MAVIDELGLKVAININGAPAAEYPDPEHSTDTEGEAAVPTARRYVQCVDNAAFSIFCQIDENHEWMRQDKNNRLVFCVVIDGMRANSCVCSRETLRPLEYGQARTVLEIAHTRCFDKETGMDIQREFQFSPISTVDDSEKKRVEEDAKTASKLGTIRVRIYRAEDHGGLEPREKAKIRLHDKFCLAEKALKGQALSHGTSLGDPVSVPPVRRRNITYIDDETQPHAIFEFLYRSKDALRQQLIIPPSPSRSPSPGKLDHLPSEEVQRLARERLAQIKEEKGSQNRLIKREFGETIDLTMDDAPQPRKRSRQEDQKDVVDLTED